MINTEPAAATLQVAIPLDGWEHVILKKTFELIDETTGKPLTTQLTHTGALVTELTLEPGESRILYIHPHETPDVFSASGNMATARNTEPIACEGIADIWSQPLTPYPIVVGKSSLESDFFRIEWEMNIGITAWIDKTRSADLLDGERGHGAFTPVYEVTPAQDEFNPSDICATRRRMGRNRKGTNVERDAGRLIRATVLDNGPLFALVELVFDVKGLSYYALHIKLFANQPRVEVSVRFHKDSVWLPENVYVALPFSLGTEAELYAEKPDVISGLGRIKFLEAASTTSACRREYSGTRLKTGKR